MDARRSASCWIVSNIPPADTHRKHKAVSGEVHKPGNHWAVWLCPSTTPRGRKGQISELHHPLSVAQCNNAGREEVISYSSRAAEVR
jgi:hypothetical protein